ncbi:O-fucosyltransferase 1 isoform X3 [Neltuma alba]|uniref:O-fucosyltransferase 1 isoform X3 n=1 Tax=Neltuma alba TaxID=207710 RepID=UPI0010A382FE|nr:O-fucosyltransferase 1-like isoform X3 [Prosopis alba]
MRRAGFHRQSVRQGTGGGLKGMIAKLSIAVLVFLICTISFLFSSTSTHSGQSNYRSEIRIEELWSNADSGGWRPSSAPRSYWPPPPSKSNGYLRVRCNGGLNQQRSAISNAVLAARIMNATLVLPELDTNSYWHDDSQQGSSPLVASFHVQFTLRAFISSSVALLHSGFFITNTFRHLFVTNTCCKTFMTWSQPDVGNFAMYSNRVIGNQLGWAENTGGCKWRRVDSLNKATRYGFYGIYDVEHFIKTLRFDVRIVESIPEIHKNGKRKKIKAFQLRPPRDAPISWYTGIALAKMKEHGAIYLTPFSHRLAEEIDNPEYQRLRCRVNYHALRFKPHIMKLSQSIVDKLRAQGHFISIHLRFEMDMLAFAGCFDIFTPEEQKILRKYREENFAPKQLIYSERRAIGKCPLTPEEGKNLLVVGQRIYLAAGELFGGDRFMKPFRSLFPRLENHSSMEPSEELVENTRGLAGSAVDYMVCLLSDIFMPTYDGPSNFANNLLGHRLYYSFRTIIRPDRKALAPIFIDREAGRTAGFGEAVRKIMLKTSFGEPHKRVPPESFYTNSWPECFCQASAKNPVDRCPPNDILEILNSQLEQETTGHSNSTLSSAYM